MLFAVIFHYLRNVCVICLLQIRECHYPGHTDKGFFCCLWILIHLNLLFAEWWLIDVSRGAAHYILFCVLIFNATIHCRHSEIIMQYFKMIKFRKLMMDCKCLVRDLRVYSNYLWWQLKTHIKRNKSDLKKETEKWRKKY